MSRQRDMDFQQFSEFSVVKELDDSRTEPTPRSSCASQDVRYGPHQGPISHQAERKKNWPLWQTPQGKHVLLRESLASPTIEKRGSMSGETSHPDRTLLPAGSLERRTDELDPANEQAALELLASSRENVDLWEEIQREPDTVRVSIIDAFGVIQNPSTLPLLGQALYDLHWEVRAAAAQALGRFERAASAQLLIQALARETDFTVRQVLVRVLGQRGDEQLAGLFVFLLLDEGQDCLVREAAAWSLGRLERRAPLESLVFALRSDPDELVRAAAARSLGMTGNEKAERPLLEALQDHDADVHDAVTWALQQLDGIKLLMQRFRDTQPIHASDLFVQYEVSGTEDLSRIAQEQLLREDAFRILTRFIEGKKGFIEHIKVVEHNRQQTLILNYFYQQTGKLLQDEVLPTIERENRVSVEPIEALQESEGDLLEEMIQRSRKIRAKRTWYEFSIVSVRLFPLGENPFQVILCGTSCETVRDDDKPVLNQILRIWGDRLKKPPICHRLYDLAQLGIWYQHADSM